MDVSTNEKTPLWQTDQSQNFVVLCVLCELPHQINPEFHWVTARVTLGLGPIFGPLGLRIKLLS